MDENTICVVGVLGTSYTFQYDPIEEINDALVKVKNDQGLDIPLHVDSATGAFIAPFLNPEFKWDFQLEQVKTINISGHKYGLVYPEIGWALWRDAADIPQSLIVEVVNRDRDQLEILILKSKDEVLRALGKNVDDEKQIAEIAHEVKELTEEIAEAEIKVKETMHAHELFAIGVTLLSIAITMSGMAVVSRHPKIWHVGLFVATAGGGFVASGVLEMFAA